VVLVMVWLAACGVRSDPGVLDTCTLSPDGTRLAGGHLTGWIGTAPWTRWPTSDPGGTCESMQTFAETCAPCPSDGRVRCLSVRIGGLSGVPVAGEIAEDSGCP
jgi:hypothetical protein